MATANGDALEPEASKDEDISPGSTDSSRLSESPDFEAVQVPGDVENIALPAAGRHPTHVELSRIETYRLQHQSTVGSATGPVPEAQWLVFGAGKPYPPPLPDPEEYVVEFTGENDPMRPHNWSTFKK